MRPTSRIRCFGILLFSGGLAVSNHASAPENLMAVTATRFVESLTAAQHANTVFDFKDQERFKWHYFPERGFALEHGRERRGIMFKEMDPKQRHLAYALMASGLSQAGFIKAATIMSVEEIVRVIEADTTGNRDAEKFHFSVFGKPADSGVWGWRVEGHHVALNFTIKDGRAVSTSPLFFGSNPHEVPTEPHRGMRVLGREEDLARDLVNSLDPAQRKRAIFDELAPFDIMTMGTVRARLETAPPGIPVSALNARQRAMLMELVEEYANNVAGPLAERRLDQARQTPPAKLYFAWAGTTERPTPRPVEIGKPTTGNRARQGIYYRVQSPAFLIEYNNTQNYSNHSHSVWRDWQGDFGADVLSLHNQMFHRQAGD